MEDYNYYEYNDYCYENESFYSLVSTERIDEDSINEKVGEIETYNDFNFLDLLILLIPIIGFFILLRIFSSKKKLMLKKLNL